MNYVSNEVQDNQKRGLLSAMFGDSRKMGLDRSITLTFSTTADRLFVNGVSEAVSGVNKTYTVASGATKYVQVITQNGSESPYVTVLKLVG